MMYLWIALAIYVSGYIATFILGETIVYFTDGITKQEVKDGLLISLLSWIGIPILIIFLIGIWFDTLPDFTFHYKRGGK